METPFGGVLFDMGKIIIIKYSRNTVTPCKDYARVKLLNWIFLF